MSLETQIAALVAAANNLTAAVNGKMTEIDAAVLAAVQAIPNMAKTLYVDAVAGSDAALGTSAAPLKTIAEAMSRTATTPYATILLAAGQTHEYYGPSNNICYRSVSNKLVFERYGAGNNPVFIPRVGDYLAGSSNIHFFVLEGGSVFFRSIDVVMPNELKAGTTDWYQGFGASLFYRAHGGTASLHGSVTFSGAAIRLGAFDVFFSGYSGNFRVDMNACSVDTTLSTKFAKLNGATMVLAVNNVSINNSKTWAHIVSGVVKDAGGSLCNVLSNIGNIIAAGV